MWSVKIEPDAYKPGKHLVIVRVGGRAGWAEYEAAHALGPRQAGALVDRLSEILGAVSVDGGRERELELKRTGRLD